MVSNKYQFLSYMIDKNTPTYGNRNQFEIIKKSSIKNGDVSNDSYISTTTHIGTHLDMPYHFYENGVTIEEYETDFFVFSQDEIIFIELDIEKDVFIIKDELIKRLEKVKKDSKDHISNYRLLIVKTGMCYKREEVIFWKKNYGFHPDIANYLRKSFPNLKVFGFDSISISSWQDRMTGREAHKAFLDPQKPILLLEDMNLCKVDKNTKFKEIVIAPLRIQNSDGIPCSIIAKISSSILNSQFSVILWDFDGVIFDSMKIKSDGFRKLFKEFDKDLVEEFIKFHLQNGGMSRFLKIKYFYEKLLNKKISEKRVQELAKKYGEIIQEKLFDRKNIIQDSFMFIKQNHKKYHFHIVSGAEHNELNKLCKFLEIDKYFTTIHGSPSKKDILIKNLLEKYNYSIDKICLIGDSINDAQAAKANKIKFFGYNNIDLKDKFYYIERF